MLSSQPYDSRGLPADGRESQAAKRRLYAPFFHWVMRIGSIFMGLSILYLTVRRAGSLDHEGIPWVAAAGAIPVLTFVALIVLFHLRTCALYGSPDGLEIARWGKRRVIPWSNVGTARYAWWYVSLLSRIATVTIHDENEHRYTFFANDQILEDLEAMRAVYTRK